MTVVLRYRGRSVSATTAEAYRQNLLILVGDRDPLDVLSQTASILDHVVCTKGETVLRTRPSPGAWTPNEVIGHLVDSEWVYGYRLRLVLSEDEPAIVGTRQDLWVQRQRHNDRAPSEQVSLFGALRQFNMAVWRRLSSADLTRTGRHNERGEESVAMMLRMHAGHDLSHLRQIDRAVRAVST